MAGILQRMPSKGLSATLLVVVVSLTSTTADEWLDFKRQFGRGYQPEEEHFRRQVFADNLEYIKQHNAEFDAGRTTFRLGVNQFADLTNEEFRLKITSQLKPAALGPATVFNNISSISIPDSFDWRNEGVSIPIQDQGQLGSWVMSVASSIEAGLVISSSHYVILSRQNLQDCVDFPSTIGALEYVRDHGIASSDDYHSGACDQVQPTAGLDEVHTVPEGDEEALAEGLLLNPVPVNFDASMISFQLYSSGIYSDSGCSTDHLDHAMMLVGYGSSSDTDFWTLANSWGTAWGEQGFMRVQRGVNMCGVASLAAYPTGVHLV